MATLAIGGAIEVSWFEFGSVLANGGTITGDAFRNLMLQLFTYLIPVAALLLVSEALSVYVNMIHGFRIERLEDEVRKLKRGEKLT